MTPVHIDAVTKRFGQQTAVDNVSLRVEAGELFFLLGPSGCGKSTLLRLIAGLTQPTAGRMFFGTRDVTSIGTQDRNAVMCFQSYALWPHMTARQNIRFGLEVRKISSVEADRRVEEAVQLVQLQKFADKKPNEMSGGQQQRVALARALVVRPDCLLLDEPLSNLDAKLRLEMRTEIRRICKASNLTAFYVTHDQKEALSIADRMAVLLDGRIEQIGRPQELYLRPKNRFVAGFMGETNFIPGRVTSIKADHATVQTLIGDITGVRGDGIDTGDSVVVSIRPEIIRFVSPSTATGTSANTFAAVVHDTIYLGEVAQHQIRVPGIGGENRSIDLRAFELNPKVVARDGAVEQATIVVDPEDVIVLADDA